MAKPKMFKVACCELRRGLLPGGILICPVCDYDHASATIIPNERVAKDVPEGNKVWTPGFEEI
jgi:hypothetical protein